jgi:hypothetical protein
LIYLALGLGVTGMGAQLTRLAGWAFISFATYYVHLVLIFCLFAYLTCFITDTQQVVNLRKSARLLILSFAPSHLSPAY